MKTPIEFRAGFEPNRLWSSVLPETCLLLSACLALPAQAQDAAEGGGRRAWSVVPRMSVSQTFTDNVNLSATSKLADQITELSPGIRILADTARLKGSIDYSLRNFISAQDSSRDRVQNALQAIGTFEAVDKWLFLDASGTISQQTISAFGPQSAGAANLNANSTETSTFRISPHVRGRLAGRVDYTLRYSVAETKVSSALASSVSTEDFAGNLVGVISGPLGWSLDGTRQSAQYGSSVRNQSDRLTGRLTYRYSPELDLFVSAGSDSNNYTSATAKSYRTSGYGVNWSPTDRTRVSVSRERQFYGYGHSISATHRMPLTAIKFTDSKSVSVLPNRTGSAGGGTYYDLLFAQLATSIPDPVVRAQEVNRQLQQSGIAPNAAITSGFLSSRISIQRRQELSLVINGLRNTVTYTLFQTASESTGAATAGLADDFSLSNSIRTSGMSSNFSHRLTGLTSLNALSSWIRTTGVATSQSTTQRLFNLNVFTRFSPKIGASLGLRTVVSEGASAYKENAVLGSITAQF